jgi:hypothetical protein
MIDKFSLFIYKIKNVGLMNPIPAENESNLFIL